MAKVKTDHTKIALLVLRVLLGVLFLYAGISKLMDPEWSAAGFLGNAKTFSGLYGWFGSEANIFWVNFLNEWGQVAIGLGLITGLFTSIAAISGIIMMILYYFPGLDFPYIGEHGFLVDDHLIYAAALYVLFATKAGNYLGLDAFLKKNKK